MKFYAIALPPKAFTLGISLTFEPCGCKSLNIGTGFYLLQWHFGRCKGSSNDPFEVLKNMIKEAEKK